VVLDRSRPLVTEDHEILDTTRQRARIVVSNKSDLPARAEKFPDSLAVSVVSGEGLNTLADGIAEALGATPERRDVPCVTNVRHSSLLSEARDALVRARDAMRASQSEIPEEFLLADLQEASASLQEITGKRSTDDLLHHIFERFCVGK
jgi:tRNA modification GTPase